MLYNTACPGTGPMDFINPHNINSFIGCTVIHGEIRILPTTFLGYVTILLHCWYIMIRCLCDTHSCKYVISWSQWQQSVL